MITKSGETAKKIIAAAQDYYGRLSADSLSSDRSWEYCYTQFAEAFRRHDMSGETVDYLSLHLAAYLASWGMYRGSSFLASKSYKVHAGAVRIILQENNSGLIGLDPELYKDRRDSLEYLIGELKNYYGGIREGVTGKKVIASPISDTLVSKILLGSVGCVPAYDRYFCNGVIKENVTSGVLNIKSIDRLMQFYAEHKSEFDTARNGMSIEGTDLCYPPMKFLDMGFWEIGYALTEK